MKFYMITFRSITFAQQGEEILRKAGIECTLTRTPKYLQDRGCSYCLRVKAPWGSRAMELLNQKKAKVGKIYAIGEDGDAEEWTV